MGLEYYCASADSPTPELTLIELHVSAMVATAGAFGQGIRSGAEYDESAEGRQPRLTNQQPLRTFEISKFEAHHLMFGCVRRPLCVLQGDAKRWLGRQEVRLRSQAAEIQREQELIAALILADARALNLPIEGVISTT